MRNKRHIKNVAAVTMLLVIGFTFVFGAHQAHASILDYPFTIVNDGLAWVSSKVLMVVSLLVVMSAYILDVSIKLTLHIKEFVDATPAIFTVWKALRDITGLFFIFYLLYVAILLVINQDSTTSYGKKLKDIIIAGILINFSFFITSVLIDASNIVSQAIYNAMIPNQPAVTLNTTTKLTDMASMSEKGGISTIFMNSLKVQAIYDPKRSQIGDTFRILLIDVAGIIMMVTTAASFMLAAIAFISRLVILIFLLAFSPLWFAGMTLMPQIKKEFDVWKILKDQLIFMPAYLLLMYVALRMLNESNFFSSTGATTSSLATGTNWMFPFIVLAINFTIVIIMLNLPLIVALKMGGVATDWMKGSIGKWDARKIWGNVGSQAGSRTLGRMAYAANQSNAVKWAASKSPLVGGLISGSLKNVSKAGFGGKKGSYEERLEAKSKAYEAMHKQIGSVDRNNYRTEAEFKDAQAQAKKYQKDYRQNIPWRNMVGSRKGTPGGVLGFLLDNRANVQTSRSLSEVADLDANTKKRDENVAKILELKGNALKEALLTDEEKLDISKLEKENEELDAAIKRGSGSKNKKDAEGMLKTLADAAKAENEKDSKAKGGDKSKGDDKPKEGGDKGDKK
jgi:hypothetical protein